MSTTVQQWPPVEVPSTSDLADNFTGLLEWVLDECDMAAENHMEEYIDGCDGQAAVNDSSALEEVDGCVEVNIKELAEYTFSPEKFTSPEHNLGEDEAKDDVQNDAMMPIEQDHRSSLQDGNQEAESILKSVTLTDTAGENSLELFEKKKIPSGVSQDKGQAAPEDKGSTSSRSISTSGQDSSPSLNKASPNRPKEFEIVRSIEVQTKVKELIASGEPSPLSVAAWVMDTTEAPVPNLVVSKAANASTHCLAINPETGAFLPVIEQPETRYNDELDLQSEPGWRRSNITSDMQISRELKAREKLARRLKERLPTQAQAKDTVPEEAESPFPKADCTLRPATDDDIAAISDIINLERQTKRGKSQKKSSDIKNWDVSEYLKKCRQEQRPFIVAIAGEDDLLDRSKWPAGADRAYKKYVQYQSMFKEVQPSIVGFAFAMPRQSLDVQETDLDHSCYITLCVHPSHRNEKYGSALLDRILMSVSPVHRSLIDFGWQCDDAVETYEQLASHNAKQYARVFVEYSEPRDAEYKLMAREKLLRKFGFRQVGHLTCMRSESRAGRRYWKDLLIWELEAHLPERSADSNTFEDEIGKTQAAFDMLSILRKARLKDKEMRILMLGLDNAGKTTIVKKILNEDVHTVSPTLGFIIKTIDYNGYKLNIWDVGGQKTLRSYWRNYFEKTDALIWVVDSTDRLRIEDCREELHGLLQEERLAGACLLIFANKTDVDGCMTEAEILQALLLDEIRTHQWHILQCSAMTGKNLKEGLAWVVEDAKKRLFLY
ncbi:hypothetical protein MY3957_006967 [Beauveria namnaoensis]